MKALIFLSASIASSLVFAADMPTGANEAGPTRGTTIYKQVTPDGRVVYSDKARAGLRVDHAISVDPPARNGVWSAQPGKVESPPLATRSTEVIRAGKPARDAAETEVIRAEMTLEDAKKRKQLGADPRPEELAETGSGDYRQGNAYRQRQKNLADDVIKAEEALISALKDRTASR